MPSERSVEPAGTLSHCGGERAIELRGVSKTYRLYQRPVDRLLEALPWFNPQVESHCALAPINLTVNHGEVVGLIGRNGAGKSTLLQLVCGTLPPSTGEMRVDGRIAALLELGSGFNPEFTGRENVYMNGAILGLSRAQIDARFEQIHAFSEIGTAIDQPVKTYSSGMFVRLAFSVAVNVDPDILVIDEALSVGDGAFARKSFERIMQLKQQGRTILFCSHNLYQIEAICNRALWVNDGQLVAEGVPSQVIKRYENFLYAVDKPAESQRDPSASLPAAGRRPRLTEVEIRVDGAIADLQHTPVGNTDLSCLTIRADWNQPAELPASSLAVTIHTDDGRMVGSAGSHIDQVFFSHDANGFGSGTIRFPDLPLLKGEYWVEVYLLCEHGVMFYDQRVPAAHFQMRSQAYGLEQGLVHLRRDWSVA